MSGPQFNSYRNMYNKGVNAIRDNYNTGVNAIRDKYNTGVNAIPVSDPRYPYVPQQNPNDQLGLEDLRHSRRGGKLHKKKKSTKRRYNKKGGSKKNYKNYKKSRRMH